LLGDGIIRLDRGQLPVVESTGDIDTPVGSERRRGVFRTLQQRRRGMPGVFVEAEERGVGGIGRVHVARGAVRSADSVDSPIA